MTVDIIGCGQSAQNWEKHGYSIGVNDAGKWGKPLDALLVANFPTRFTPERHKIITETKVDKFYTSFNQWSAWFPDLIKIKYVGWYGVIRPNQIYYANTSPFIAISLAYTLGAKKIALWGVDMLNHQVFNSSNPETVKEINMYMDLIRELKELDVEVYLGSKGSVFDNLIPIYE